MRGFFVLRDAVFQAAAIATGPFFAQAIRVWSCVWCALPIVRNSQIEGVVPMERKEELCRCIDACAACVKECSCCATHCAKEVMDGNEAHYESSRMCLDCADVCALTAKIVARGGPMSAEQLELCADVCQECAICCESCGDDEHMKRCAEACRTCAEACKGSVLSAVE
jgi:hypothetical protein